MNIFFTADTHFWHTNQAKRRGFATVEAMNHALIEAWNARVGYGDTVYHLGDLSFAGSKRTGAVIERLRGNIKIVPGNHDDRNTLRNMATWRESEQQTFEILPPLHTLKIAVNRPDGENDVHRFVLCHFPLLVWDRSHYGVPHLHGHSHGNLQFPNPKAKILDVGVDTHADFAPWSLEEVLKVMAGRVNDRAFDHHDASMLEGT